MFIRADILANRQSFGQQQFCAHDFCQRARRNSAAPGSSYDTDSWEPRDVEKGAIARSAFYMAVRYDGSDPDVPDLELSDSPSASLYRFGKLTTLLFWHRHFSVTPPEQQRNQTNRPLSW